MPSFQASGTRAILIGSSTFEDTEIENLPSVANGVTDLAHLLADPDLIGIPRENIHVLLNEAWAPKLVNDCVDAARLATDTLLVYFAGHGFVAGRENGLYLATGSSLLRNIAFTGLHYETLRSAILEAPARRKILIMDCCYSGRALGAMGDSAGIIEANLEIEGVYSMASSAANLTAAAPPGERYTAFSGELIHVLMEGIETSNPEISMDELFEEVRSRLVSKGRPRPLSKTSGDADRILIARNRAFRSAAMKREAELQGALDVLQSNALEETLRSYARDRILPSGIIGRAYSLIHTPASELSANDEELIHLLVRLSNAQVSVGDFIERWMELEAQSGTVQDGAPQQTEVATSAEPQLDVPAAEGPTSRTDPDMPTEVGTMSAPSAEPSLAPPQVLPESRAAASPMAPPAAKPVEVSQPQSAVAAKGTLWSIESVLGVAAAALVIALFLPWYAVRHDTSGPTATISGTDGVWPVLSILAAVAGLIVLGVLLRARWLVTTRPEAALCLLLGLLALSCVIIRITGFSSQLDLDTSGSGFYERHDVGFYVALVAAVLLVGASGYLSVRLQRKPTQAER